jgi:RNA polymerase sigma-70 factor (ECF subfamily)
MHRNGRAGPGSRELFIIFSYLIGMERSLAMPSAAVAAGLDDLDNAALVELARRRHGAAFRLIMQRHNRRPSCGARSVPRDDPAADDVVQEASIRVLSHLDRVRGQAPGCLRQRCPTVDLKHVDTIRDQGEARVIFLPSAHQDSGPEAAAARCARMTDVVRKRLGVAEAATT